MGSKENTERLKRALEENHAEKSKSERLAEAAKPLVELIGEIGDPYSLVVVDYISAKFYDGTMTTPVLTEQNKEVLGVTRV